MGGAPSSSASTAGKTRPGPGSAATTTRRCAAHGACPAARTWTQAAIASNRSTARTNREQAQGGQHEHPKGCHHRGRGPDISGRGQRRRRSHRRAGRRRRDHSRLLRHRRQPQSHRRLGQLLVGVYVPELEPDRAAGGHRAARSPGPAGAQGRHWRYRAARAYGRHRTGRGPGDRCHGGERAARL
jgi:hypothetical protein